MGEAGLGSSFGDSVQHSDRFGCAHRIGIGEIPAGSPETEAALGFANGLLRGVEAAVRVQPSVGSLNLLRDLPRAEECSRKAIERIEKVVVDTISRAVQVNSVAETEPNLPATLPARIPGPAAAQDASQRREPGREEPGSPVPG